MSKHTPHVVRLTVEYIVWQPAEWEPSTRAHHADESCVDNAINQLAEMVEAYENLPDDCFDENGASIQGPACFCACGNGEYLRPATAHDLRWLPAVGGPKTAMEWAGKAEAGE